MTLADCFPYQYDTLNYLAHISDQRRFFYLGNPKVCSTTILAALQSAELGREVSPQLEVIHDRSHSPLKSFATCVTPHEEIISGDRFFRFTYVRNPYTRVLSAYLHKVVAEEWARAEKMPELGLDPNAEISFEAFLRAVRDMRDDWRDVHWRSQAGMIQPGRVRYHFIGRFESFAETFPHAMARVGASASAAAQEHVTDARKKLSEYLGPVERDLIAEVYEQDFLVFGYGFDPGFASL